MTDHNDSPPRRTWTVAEVGQQTGVPEDTVRGWVRTGVLPSVRIGGRRLIRAADLDALLNHNQVERK